MSWENAIKNAQQRRWRVAEYRPLLKQQSPLTDRRLSILELPPHFEVRGQKQPRTRRRWEGQKSFSWKLQFATCVLPKRLKGRGTCVLSSRTSSSTRTSPHQCSFNNRSARLYKFYFECTICVVWGKIWSWIYYTTVLCMKRAFYNKISRNIAVFKYSSIISMYIVSITVGIQSVYS